MNVKFSIIIPVYNEEGFIESLLYSLKGQSLHTSKFEIIIVDNNSTDKSIHFINAFKKENPKLTINIIEEQKAGVCSARNAGARNARGDYLVFLDADNIVYPLLLAEIQNKIKVGYKAGTICTMPFETTIRGYAAFYLMELAKCTIPKPFGKNFCYKPVFETVGGYDETKQYVGTNLRFLSIVQKYLHSKHYKLTHIKTPIVTSMRRFEASGYFNILSKWALAYVGIGRIFY